MHKPHDDAHEPTLPNEMPLGDLARAVLAGELRPRVSQLRRLAEAVLAAEAKPKNSKHKDKGKKRKLAKIPRPKKKDG